ncbi:unnamed protein product [Calicophoron daubneyi]|uniref:CCZ1/INTU/HSP4 first Longin domain-containing protein n=1 Tax=Calicophoron daubneyi TaxID=300641 RepID=A0AAV2U118_CALDB
MLTIEKPRLSELFVHCPSLCLKEDEEYKKILYYFPPNKLLNDRLNSIGLCEAVMTFTRFFDSNCCSLHTLNTKRFFHKLSEDVWIVMVITLPSRGKDSEYSSFRISDETVSDQIMGSVLKNACDTFELFNGKVSALVSDEGLETLSLRLDHFFSRYLRTMLFEHYDLLDCFNGIQFTAIEPTDFARVEGFLNRIKYAFSSVRYTAFFYDGQLVKSDLDLDYARHLYHYLNSFLFVEQPDLNHTGTASKHKHLGRVYPFRPVEENATGAVVSLSALGAPTTVEDEVASAVEDFAGGDSLSMSAIGRSRFVYWNPSTFAILSTMHVYTGSGRRPLNGTKAILDAMASLRCELLLRPYSWHEEITVRLDPYVWIVARRSNGREVYMLFIRKHENLAKLDKYVSRLNSSTFRGLMMLD